MKKRKTLPALLLLLALLLSPGLPAAAAEADETTVSPWAAEEVQRAEGFGLLPLSPLMEDYGALEARLVTDWRQPITRAQFVRFALSYAAAMNHCDEGSFRGLVRNLMAEKTENGYSLKMPFTDDATEDVALAYTLGLVEGRGGGIFDPNAPITRQEAAALLYRTYAVCGGTPEEDTAEPFADEGDIADWARVAVHSLRQRDVLRGMGENTFDPKGNFTVQQCAVSFLRLYELMPVSRLRGSAVPLFDREETIRGVVGKKEEVLRLEGPRATLLATDFSAMHATRNYFFIYPEGGARHIAPAVSTWYQDCYMEDPAFSQDGGTLSYTITLEWELTHWDEEAQLQIVDYEPGIYSAEMDVETGTQTVTRTPLEEKARWTDVPEDAWYYDDAVYCVDSLALISEPEKGVFAPEEPITQGRLLETTAHVYSYLAAGSDSGWGLPLRPEHWGEAVVTGENGEALAAFRAWEPTSWRAWTGPMNTDPYHYSIPAEEEAVLAAFPALADGGQGNCPATLDMGDKQLSGRLFGTLNGDLEAGGPAFLFYPEETGDYKDGGSQDPAAPTQLFLAAQPGGEGQSRGIYYFAERGIFASGALDAEVSGWELAYFLYRLSLSSELPESVFRPIHEITLPEDTPFGAYLLPLYRAGLLPWGEGSWEFDAYAPVTRAQFAAVLHRLLEPDAR